MLQAEQDDASLPVGSQLTAVAGAAAVPDASTTMSAPSPSVAARMAAAGDDSERASTRSLAPSRRAVSSRCSFTSTAMTGDIPAPTPQAMTKLPMPPTPITASASPERGAPRASAWRATASGCAMAAETSSHASGTGTQIFAGVVTSSAKPPST